MPQCIAKLSEESQDRKRALPASRQILHRSRGRLRSTFILIFKILI